MPHFQLVANQIKYQLKKKANIMSKHKFELIEEAKKRGYSSGTIIDYEESFSGTDTLGTGEFDLVDGKLIKYESTEKSNFRRFDTIFDHKKGWVKIATKKHGTHFNQFCEAKEISF